MDTDQILFWDTSPDGTVSMSKSKKELRNKIISAHLTGGHVVIRPAELFEGEDFYFHDAVDESGFLYNLMKSGSASLAIDHHTNIEERAEWRFRDGTVFDRGLRYTSKTDIDRIRRRTEYRAERIVVSGWKNCPHQISRNKDQFEKALNTTIRYLLATVSDKYMKGGIEADAAINYFINSSVQVSSRSDLYDVIDECWSLDVEKNIRKILLMIARGY